MMFLNDSLMAPVSILFHLGFWNAVRNTCQHRRCYNHSPKLPQWYCFDTKEGRHTIQISNLLLNYITKLLLYSQKMHI